MKILIFILMALAGALLGFSAVGNAAAHKVTATQTVLYKNVPKPGTKPTNQACLASRESDDGDASWYGTDFHGQPMANGARFDMEALTAAHRTLPFGTRVMVRNKYNGKILVVKITDRGPYAEGRIIDVSKEASRKLGFILRGTAPVEIRKCLTQVAFEREQRAVLKIRPKVKPKRPA
jgi:rare lipoprotein A